jgi:hypothetical protein
MRAGLLTLMVAAAAVSGDLIAQKGISDKERHV